MRLVISRVGAVVMVLSAAFGVAAVASPGRASASPYDLNISFDAPVTGAVVTLTEIDSGTVTRQSSDVAPTGTASITVTMQAPNSNLSLLDLSVVDTTGTGNPPASILSVTDDENNTWTRAVSTYDQSSVQSSSVTAEQWYCAQLGLARPAVPAAEAGQASAPGGPITPATVTSSSVMTGASLGDVVIADVGYADGSLSVPPSGFVDSTPQSSGGVEEQGGYMTGAFQGSYSYGGTLDTSEPDDDWAATAVAFDDQEIFQVQRSDCDANDATACINQTIRAAQATYGGFAPPASSFSVTNPPPAKPTVGPEIVPNMVYIPAGVYDLTSVINGASVQVDSPTWSGGGSSPAGGDFPDWGVPVDIVGDGPAQSANPTTLMANVREDQQLLAVRASGSVVSNIDLDGFDGPVCSGLGGCASQAFSTNANDVTLEDFSAEGDNQFIAVNFDGPSNPPGVSNDPSQLDCTEADSQGESEPTITSAGVYTPAECNYNDVAQNGTIMAQPQLVIPAGNGAIVMALQNNATMSDLTVEGDYFGAWQSYGVTASNITVEPGPVNNYPNGFEAWITGSSDVHLQNISVEQGTYGLVGAGRISCAPHCKFGQALGVQISNEQAPLSNLDIGDVGSAADPDNPAAPGVSITDSTFKGITVDPKTIPGTSDPTGDGGLSPASGTIDASTYQGLRGDIQCGQNTVASSGGIRVLGSAGLDLCPATSGPPTQLVFTAEPSPSVAAGSNLTVQVTIEDAQGRVVTSDDEPVSLSLAAGPAGSELESCQGATQFGVADLTCQLDQAGGGYELDATTTVVPLQNTSTAFTVTPGAPARLLFTGEPPPRVASASKFRVRVTAVDAFGNPITGQDLSVLLKLPGPTGGPALSCSVDPVETQAGSARFQCSIDQPGQELRLKAKSPGLRAAVSVSLQVT